MTPMMMKRCIIKVDITINLIKRRIILGISIFFFRFDKFSLNGHEQLLCILRATVTTTTCVNSRPFCAQRIVLSVALLFCWWTKYIITNFKRIKRNRKSSMKNILIFDGGKCNLFYKFFNAISFPIYSGKLGGEKRNRSSMDMKRIVSLYFF